MLRKILARDWDIDVWDKEESKFVEVDGITSITFSSDMTEAETTDFNSEGWAEHIPAERTKSLSVEGNYLEDATVYGGRDQGQEAIDEAAKEFGIDGIIKLHLRSPYGGTALILEGSVNPGDVGGDTNDVTAWGFDFLVSGKPQEAAYYDVTFEFEDPTTTEVTLDGETKTTTMMGTVVFSDKLPGVYEYIAERSGEDPLTGTVEVIDEDVTVELAFPTEA